MSDPAATYIEILETLTPETLDRLDACVTDGVHFRDPFNDVEGRDAMRRVFADMFASLGDVRFRVTDHEGDATRCFLTWRFEARLMGKPWSFEGTSVVRFSADGRVCEHLDYWDAAANFYERLPIIRWPLAAIRRRLRVK